MGHELTNLFILAGSLFLLFIGYLAYQLASTEKGTRNLLLFFGLFRNMSDEIIPCL